MRVVEKAIDDKEQDAVDVGCLYVLQQERTPSGKTHKDNVLARLRRNSELIRKMYIPDLIKTHEELVRLPYPPRETKSLEKLLIKIGAKTSLKIIDSC